MKEDDLEKAAELAARAKACRQLIGSVAAGSMQITVSGLTLSVAEVDPLRYVLNDAVKDFGARSLKQALSDLKDMGVDVQPKASEITGFEDDV